MNIHEYREKHLGKSGGEEVPVPEPQPHEKREKKPFPGADGKRHQDFHFDREMIFCLIVVIGGMLVLGISTCIGH